MVQYTEEFIGYIQKILKLYEKTRINLQVVVTLSFDLEGSLSGLITHLAEDEYDNTWIMQSNSTLGTYKTYYLLSADEVHYCMDDAELDVEFEVLAEKNKKLERHSEEFWDLYMNSDLAEKLGRKKYRKLALRKVPKLLSERIAKRIEFAKKQEKIEDKNVCVFDRDGNILIRHAIS